MTRRTIAAALAVALGGVAVACGKRDDDGARTSGDSTPAAASAKRSGADRNACDLLTDAEVSAAAGVPVKAQETHRETGRSDCSWIGADNYIAMSLVAYWTGGKEGWEILAGSRAMAKDMIQKNEGVDMDSVVKSGPVSGLGDKARFSDILPSLVLKDNVLLEFTFSLLPEPALHFRSLATKALSRL